MADDVPPAEDANLVPPGDPNEWLVLGIESSCDDTGAAVVRGDGTVLGEVLASQAGVHETWGGVVPKLAQAAHSAAIDRTVEEALRISGVTPDKLTAVAVTVGPGLSLCLDVGVRKAMALTQEHQIRLVRTHHMESHAMVTWLPTAPPPRLELIAASEGKPDTVAEAATSVISFAPKVAPEVASPAPTAAPPPSTATTDSEDTAAAATAADVTTTAAAAATAAASTAASAAAAATKPSASFAPMSSTELSPDGTPPFPYLTLLVSGGHNMLVLTAALGKHTILGSTLDDSVGEAFDKTARLLGITKVRPLPRSQRASPYLPRSQRASPYLPISPASVTRVHSSHDTLVHSY